MTIVSGFEKTIPELSIRDFTRKNLGKIGIFRGPVGVYSRARTPDCLHVLYKRPTNVPYTYMTKYVVYGTFTLEFHIPEYL
jgi:hypothetical protein